MDRSWLGTAEINPGDAVPVGSRGTWTLTYTVGRYGIDDGGAIRIARRGDWEPPQFAHPQGPGYTSVATTGAVRLLASFGGHRHIRPWRAALQVDVRDGSLREGDAVVVTFGDRRGGGPGIRAQTFRETEDVFKVLVDCFGSGRYEEIAASPRLRIVGGPAETLGVVAPSDAVTGQPLPVTVHALDSYGNLAERYEGVLTVSCSDAAASLPAAYRVTRADGGVKRFDDVVLRSPGVHTIRVTDAQGRGAASNPVEVQRQPSELYLFWGDIHGQTRETVGVGTLDEYFTYLRDVAAMDFGGWQGNDFQVTRALWRDVIAATRRYHQPGRFVVFLGYEWSGLTPAGGDHNIYFLHDEGPLHRSSHWLLDDTSDEDTDRYPLSALWDTFRGRRDVLAIAHVGGRHANLDFFDEERIPLIEVHSSHGTFEWFLHEALRRGLRVGFVANSDDHTCRPGLAPPAAALTRLRSTRGGYVGVYASALTRAALWDALRRRRCYATTGERLRLWVDVDGTPMGAEVTARTAPAIHVRVVGTAPLHEVEVKRGVETIYRHPFARPVDVADRWIKIQWSGVRVRSRPKRVDWTGSLTLTAGRFVAHRPFALDDPSHGVRRVTTQRLEWTSTTAGDPDGVLVALDAPDDAEIAFYAKPVAFTFRPRDVGYEPLVVDAGGVDCQVKVSAITRDELPMSLEFRITDPLPVDGVHPYWVRVVQSNGAMAWSSPIYVQHHDDRAPR